MKEALTLALEALEAIYTVGDVACVVKPEGEIYLKPVIDKCKAALAQPEEQQSCDKRTWVGLTDEEMWEAVRPLCAANQIATVLVELSKDEYQAIAAKLKEKNT